MNFRNFCDWPTGCENPTCAGLLYAYCPAAAKWWRSGAEPLWPYDPVTEALKAMARGLSLRETLEALSLDPLLEDARKYVEQVQAFRDQTNHRNLRAPELLPTFLGARLSVQKRHAHSAALDTIGGWQNFYRFIRAWAFVIPDWKVALHMAPETRIVETRRIVAPRLEARIWCFEDQKRSVIGLLVADAGNSGSLFPMLVEKALQANQILFLLDSFGQARRPAYRLATLEIDRQVERLTVLADEGPYPPLRALAQPLSCRECGYVHLCWHGTPDSNVALTPLALAY